MNKSALILVSLLMAACSVAFAENVNLHNTESVPYSIDCETATSATSTQVKLYDSGGSGSSYSANESYEMDLISNTGGYVALYFSSFNLAAGTMMTIKDLVSQEVLVSNATGNQLQGQTVRALHGGIKIIWHSSSATSAGFEAKVYCGHACQAFNTQISITGDNVTTSTVDGEEYVNLCSGTTINLRAQNTFEQNGDYGYTQTDGNLTYNWYIINSEQDTARLNGQVTTYTFSEGGGYFIVCDAVDAEGCYNTYINKRKLRVSSAPGWNVGFSPDSVCPGSLISFHGAPIAEEWTMEIPTVLADSMFIPDGNNNCYSTSLVFDIFEEGATVTSVNDIDHIYFKIEHSFLGDLSMMIQCPNGQNCLLKAKSTTDLTASFINWTNTGGVLTQGSIAGSGTHLGLAHDDGSCNNDPGYGFDYYFYPTGTEGFGQSGTTISVNRSDYADSLLCPNQVQYTSILAPGPEHRYGPYENMSSLIGCPLNGTWTIYICDLWASDNGWIFEWGLFFRDDLYPDNLWSFSNTYPQSGYSWSGEGLQSGQHGNPNSTAIVQNTDMVNMAQIPYTFEVTDDFGCNYDTTVTVHVLAAHDPQCCIEPTPVVTAGSTTPCGNSTTLSTTLSNPSNTGEWTYTGPGVATFSNINLPQTTVTVNVYGDYVFTWREYYMGNQTCFGEASTNVNFAQILDPTLADITSRCRSGEMIVLSAPNFGTVTCQPNTDAFNADARTFTPSLAAPGTYRITNAISGERCADPTSSTKSFVIYDELSISNRHDTCSVSGANPMVSVDFDVHGVANSTPPSYRITGYYTEYEDNNELRHHDTVITTYGTSTHFNMEHHSALDYALLVRDEQGCSSINVPGYYACDCPNFAGTFGDYSPQIMCTGETYTINHRGETIDPLGGIFSYVICTDPLNIVGTYVCTLEGTTTSVSLGSITGGNDNVQYYIVAVAGYGSGIGAWGNGCRSVSQAVPLMWKTTPTPTVTGGETCGLVMRLNGSTPASGMRGYWTAEGAGNYSYTTIDNTDNTMPNAMVLSGSYGVATYTWNVVNAECTGHASAEYNFRRIPQPQAGADTTVCGVSAAIVGARKTIPEITGSTIQWTASGVTLSPANFITPTANANSSGTYVLTLTERNGECAGSDDVRITFVSVPSPAVTANVDTVCGYVAELQVYNTSSLNEGRWTAYTDEAMQTVLDVVSYQDYNNPYAPSSDRYPHCNVTVPIPENVTEIEYYFKWSEPVRDPRLPEGAECEGEAVKKIVFRKVPVISVHQCGSTGDRISICGRSVELCAETSASEGYSNFSWVCKDMVGSFDNDSLTNHTTYTLNESTVINRYRDMEFYFIASNRSCMTIDTMHVRFLQMPVANAGLNHVACGRDYVLEGAWSLNPADDYTPVCQWTVGSKPTGAPDPTWTNTPHDSIVEPVRVSMYGVYTFVVRETNTAGQASSCYSYDTVTVEFMAPPIVDAGRDTVYCGLDFQMNATSSGIPGVTGNWVSLLGGAAAFEDPSDPHTTGHFSQYGTYTFRWTETNYPHIETVNPESCADWDTVNITFLEVPSASININDADTAVCGLTYEFLRADDPGSGINGYWYEINPGTVFGAPNQTVTDVTVPNYGPHDFYWIEYTGDHDNPRLCKDTSDAFTVTFLQMPIADIILDTITFCSNQGRINVNYNGVGTVFWSSKEEPTVYFDDQTDYNTIIHTTTLNSLNPSHPYYTVYWSVQNTGLCTAEDSVKVAFANNPSDSIKVVPPKCFGEPAIITAYEENLALYEWEYNLDNVIGELVRDSINTQGGEYKIFVKWPDRPTSTTSEVGPVHTVRLTATNSWGCASSGRAEVQIPRLPKYNYNIIGDTCALGKGGIEFLDTTGVFAFFWIDTTVGPEILNPAIGTALTTYHVYDLPAGNYNYRADYQTFNRDYSETYRIYFGDDKCHDTAEFEIPLQGMMHAQFAISLDVDLYNLVAPDGAVVFVRDLSQDDISNKKCEWHFGDGVIEKNCDELVEHIYTEPGCYEPYLIVMNKDYQECRDTALLELEIPCIDIKKASSLDIPNIFSPNNDGINDFFQVKAESLKDNFNGKIVNRYGRVVYEWTNWKDEDAGWDGRLNGTTKATPGVYFYIIQAEGLDGVPYNEEGSLHLVR